MSCPRRSAANCTLDRCSYWRRWWWRCCCQHSGQELPPPSSPSSTNIHFTSSALVFSRKKSRARKLFKATGNPCIEHKSCCVCVCVVLRFASLSLSLLQISFSFIFFIHFFRSVVCLFSSSVLLPHLLNPDGFGRLPPVCYLPTYICGPFSYALYSTFYFAGSRYNFFGRDFAIGTVCGMWKQKTDDFHCMCCTERARHGSRQHSVTA